MPQDTREDRTETREAKGRAQRTPLGVRQAKLAAEIEEGYVGRWVNDDPGRIQRALSAGYEHVEAKANGQGRAAKQKQQVGTHPDGSPKYAYLMKIRQEFYDEDQAMKEAGNAEVDAALTSGRPDGADARDAGSFYDAGSKIAAS